MEGVPPSEEEASQVCGKEPRGREKGFPLISCLRKPGWLVPERWGMETVLFPCFELRVLV